MTRSVWKAGKVLGSFLMAGILGVHAVPAIAGPEEDFAAAKASYLRGDFAAAMPLMRKVADAGNLEAQVLMASMLDAAEYDEEALAYYRKAADAGSLDGMYGLAGMLATGEGTPKKPAEALAWLRKAASLGHKPSIRGMAQAYMRGEMGILEAQKKSADALPWITKAADDNYIPAMQALEKGYREGEYGLAVDLAMADQIRQKILKLTGPPAKKGRRRGESK